MIPDFASIGVQFSSLMLAQQRMENDALTTPSLRITKLFHFLPVSSCFSGLIDLFFFLLLDWVYYFNIGEIYMKHIVQVQLLFEFALPCY